MNALATELSPYLLQHAHNPVDWRPWGDEAFEEARRLDKPVFISIGYSTCHWCHVMERESFEDERVAAALNEAFVCVKVDREERPDVDAVYMHVCQMLSGSGGWPLTLLLTPERKPFFAATYLPPRARQGRIGVVELCDRVAAAWKDDRAQIEDAARGITDALDRRLRPPDPDAAALSVRTLGKAYRELAARFDSLFGGFGRAPKFPTPHQGAFLVRYAERTGEADAVEMVETTLRKMRLGGIFDHLGGGFHRYSTDRMWRLPHFEKMLYDQALLALLYTDLFSLTRRELYERTAREIFDYVLRDLTSPEGGFFSAEDADSEGREGAFYVWTMPELRAVLGDEDAAFFGGLYSFKEEGNFEEEATQEKTGENIPHLANPLSPEDDVRVARLREKLFRHRQQRTRPHLDDKILTDWNGLMIAALAKAGRAFGDASLTAHAERAARFVLTHLRDERGQLMHRHRAGHSGLDALADDYAFFIWGLLELFQSNHDPEGLRAALELQADFYTRFRDETLGAFTLRPHDGERLITRTIDLYDGALPSANSVALLNSARLYRLTGDDVHRQVVEGLLDYAAEEVGQYAAEHTAFLIGLDEWIGPSGEVVLAGGSDEEAAPFLEVLREAFLPRMFVIRLTRENRDALTRVLPAHAHYPIPEAGVRAYVCQNFRCEAPVSTPQALKEQVAGDRFSVSG